MVDLNCGDDEFGLRPFWHIRLSVAFFIGYRLLPWILDSWFLVSVSVTCWFLTWWGRWSYAKPPRLDDRWADFRRPSHPRPLRLGWTFSGTALGVPVRRKPSHHWQGISIRESSTAFGLALINSVFVWLIFFEYFLSSFKSHKTIFL